jgi:hypothetical protein
MSMTVRRLLPILALALAAGGAASPLAATSFVRVSDEALADQAAVAAVARIESVDRRAGARSGGPVATEYGVRLERVLKGRAAGLESLRVRVPGGEGPDGRSLRVAGAPAFRPGERAILFLEPAGGGAFRPLHLFLGVFHEVAAGGLHLAVRDLAGASELRVTAEGLAAAPSTPDPPRDFEAFARWIAARAAGKAAPGYLAPPVKFTLYSDAGDGVHLRWFAFDEGGGVEWRALDTGETGIAGGGYAEFQNALRAWTDEPATRIDYRYAGTTPATAGLSRSDGINAVVFDDPADFVSPFDCVHGGVLAIGGPWYETETIPWRGEPWHRIVEGDVVVNNGLACLFARAGNPSRLAEEILGHELGHTLGLGHSCGDAVTPACASNVLLDQALMRAFVHDDGRGARLESDDRAGLRKLYDQGEPPAAPARLAAVALSPVEVSLTWKDRSPDETGFRVEMRTVDGDFSDIGSVPAGLKGALVQGLQPASSYVFRVRASRGGVLSGPSNEAAVVTPAVPGPCVADAWTLCLAGRYRVQASWKARDGRMGAAAVLPIPAGDSGLFWFLDPGNAELLVKALDGCAENGRRWIFIGPATNFQYVLTVVDTRSGKARVYFNPQGVSPRAVTDADAFGDCP